MPYVNVFHCFLPANSVSSDAQLTTWLTAFHNALGVADLIGQRSNTLHVTQFEAVLHVGEVLNYRATNTTPLNGGRVSQPLSAAMNAVISWHSSAYWRGGKPRTYLGGMMIENVDTNHSLIDAQKTAIAGQAQTFLNGVSAITTAQVPETQMGFIHWQSKDQWLIPPTFYKFTGASVHDRLGTQRRRLGPWLP